MAFTDEDLKRLKDGLPVGAYASFIQTGLPALLARLEAAEAVIAIWENLDPSLQDSPIYTAWRKANGQRKLNEKA